MIDRAMRWVVRRIDRLRCRVAGHRWGAWRFGGYAVGARSIYDRFCLRCGDRDSEYRKDRV